MRRLVVSLLVVFAPSAWSETEVSPKNCGDENAAKLVSLQGRLFIDPASQGDWREARLEESFCEGSRIRVEPYSRASLLLPNGITLRLDEGTVLSLNGIAADKPTLLDMVKGFVHFISRTPKQLKITTPIANAGPEGTEFALNVDDGDASLWVYEGAVKFYNDKGDVRLNPGEGATAHLGQAPQTRIDIKPLDAVNWALYYPSVLPYPDASATVDANLRAAIDEFRRGRADAALARLDALAPEQQTPYFFKVRAAMRLTSGRVDPALQDIKALQATNPNDAEALALQSVLALTQNRKEDAFDLANSAIAADPHSSAAYSALSYAEQGRFSLEKALAAADQATKLAPHDALVWARKAELELATGLKSESDQSARRALELDAGLERTQTVMGFSHLFGMDTDEALQSFETAVKLDSTAPLPRLGLGLTKIRKGDIEAGRRDLEVAATLDPNNSIIRSYLGKAYYEEKRGNLAQDQFDLAKQRDPKDPTPYFYDAINKQTTNRPVEALHDMLKAMELNDNREVYRSKLLLDEDAAARSANMARIYNDLGFGRVALKEAWTSIGHDTANPSAHRFLSDAYIGQPRYRVARASELLQAQLLQPINITPVQPQLTGENIGILNNTGPGSLSVNEYDALYTANGAHVVLNGAYGSRNTKTDNAIVSAVYDKLAMSLGQFHYHTDGFRQNDDYQQNIYDAFAQYAFTPNLNLQIELKSENIRAGDLPTRLNGYHDDTLRQTIKQDTARIGGHYKIDPEQDIIASGFYTSRRDSNYDRTLLNDAFFTFVNDFSVATKNQGYQAELQYLFHPENFEIISGFGYLNQVNTIPINSDTTVYIPFPPFSFSSNSFARQQYDTDHFNGYVYTKQHWLPSLTTTLGVSFDSVNNHLNSFESDFLQNPRLMKGQQFNPKFGVTWNLVEKLTLRGAAFRSMSRILAANQTLEPTQIAGFNQFYDDNNNASAWRYGLGMDYSVLKTVFIGGELSWRNSQQPINNGGIFELQNRDETSHLAYLYWTPADWLALKTEYRFEKTNREYTVDHISPKLPQGLQTHQVPIAINFFHDSGLFTRVTGTYVNQRAASVTSSFTDPLAYQSEDFWTFDTAIGYRFPKKFGAINFEVRNLFDNKFNYQSNFDASGPQISPYIPERQLFVKLSLFY